MRLPEPFYRLPVRFDVERLRAEVGSLSNDVWVEHPNNIPGNTSVRLISRDGVENDAVNGAMLPTRHLEYLPYVRQVLASFGVVWSRSRLLRLAPRANVPEHADINYHWFSRVRLHIPVFTRPEVSFFCGPRSVHMAAGEAWIFDNWRQHRVENQTDYERIHLVADTSGSDAFWRLVAEGEQPGHTVYEHRYDPSRSLRLMTERAVLPRLMPPAEVDLLLLDLRAQLTIADGFPEGSLRLRQYRSLLDFLSREWRQLYVLHGEEASTWDEFRKLRDHVRARSKAVGLGIIVAENRVAARSVLEGRVLSTCVPEQPTAAGTQVPRVPSGTMPRTVGTPTMRSRPLERPVFVVAAPRSGSTLLFETLAASPCVCTVGGEAHWLVESLEELRPGFPGVESNRLDAKFATEAIGAEIRRQILDRVLDSAGLRVNPATYTFLEKTPKNALRIPFFARLFPDALFIFLWRDPRESISSIMEAWRAGRWRTYPHLEGFELPWSLLLPPGWPRMRGRPLEDIAAFQWEVTNRIVLEDLAECAPGRYTSLRYDEMLTQPAATVERLCEFVGIQFDTTLARRTSGPLPCSRHTLTAPAKDKWRANAAAVEKVLPGLQDTWQRLLRLAAH